MNANKQQRVPSTKPSNPPITQGSMSVVSLADNGNILKEFDNDLGYEHFLKFCKLHPNDPHLPKIYSVVRGCGRVACTGESEWCVGGGWEEYGKGAVCEEGDISCIVEMEYLHHTTDVDRLPRVLHHVYPGVRGTQEGDDVIYGVSGAYIYDLLDLAEDQGYCERDHNIYVGVCNSMDDTLSTLGDYYDEMGLAELGVDWDLHAQNIMCRVLPQCEGKGLGEKGYANVTYVITDPWG